MVKVGTSRNGCAYGAVPKIIIIYRAANGNRYPFMIDAQRLGYRASLVPAYSSYSYNLHSIVPFKNGVFLPALRPIFFTRSKLPEKT